MAIRRETFEATGVRDYWQRGIIDDGSLTLAVRRANMEIAFAPQALAATFVTYTFRQMLEWTTRQVKLLRCHLSQLWNVAFVAHGLSTVGLLVGLCGGVLGVAPGATWYALAVLGIDVFEWGLITFTVRSSMDAAIRVRASPWHGVFFSLAALLFLFNALASPFSRRMTWRGITLLLTTISTAESGQR